MAPDLEMRLSFPKRSPPTDEPNDSDKIDNSTLNRNLFKKLNTSMENLNYISNRPATRDEPQNLPVNFANVKKSLAKGNIGEKSTCEMYIYKEYILNLNIFQLKRIPIAVIAICPK